MCAEEKKNIPSLRFRKFKANWSEFQLGKVSEIRTGPFGSLLHQSDYVEDGTPIITVEHLGETGVLHQNLPLVSDKDKTRLKSYILNDGDIVFSRVGSVDRNSLVREEESGWLFSGRLLRIRTSKKVQSRFLSFYFQVEKNRHRIRSAAVGQTMPSLNTEILQSFLIKFPAYDEQEKISAFLSSIDEKLNKLRRKRELLKTYKRGVMQKIFSQELRFKRKGGGDYPEWEEKRAHEIFSNHSDKNHNGDLPILAATQDGGMVYRDGIGKDIKTSEASINSYKVVEVGDFVISLRSFQGGIEYSNVHGICSPAYTILKPAVEIDNDFYRHYFKRESFISQLSATVIGIRDGKQISYDAFSGMKLWYPSVPEQKKISEFISSIDEKILVQNKRIEQIETFKQGLLQKMFI